MINTYDIYTGKDLEIAELIQQRRLQILVHSRIYYELNQNIDEVIKAKVDEIIHDPNSEYKDYPDYYKLGKFVHNNMNIVCSDS